MIKNYRYSSSWEQFEEAVKILKDLIEQKKACWMIGFVNDIDIIVDESEGNLPEKIQNIIDDEILYLMQGVLSSKGFDEEKFKRTLWHYNPDTTEEEINTSTVSFCNKLELIKDTFDIERLSHRYQLKNESLNHKLSDINYNIYTHHLQDGGKARCALVSLSSKRNLEKDDKADNISFVCDKEDIDILIRFLQDIKGDMEEE